MFHDDLEAILLGDTDGLHEGSMYGVGDGTAGLLGSACDEIDPSVCLDERHLERLARSRTSRESCQRACQAGRKRLYSRALFTAQHDSREDSAT